MKRFVLFLLAASALLLVLPFLFVKPRMDKFDYRKTPRVPGEVRVFSPLPYSPFEQVGRPYAPPDSHHILGCDSIGRDVASRLIYGARVSLAVGIFATAIGWMI